MANEGLQIAKVYGATTQETSQLDTGVLTINQMDVVVRAEADSTPDTVTSIVIGDALKARLVGYGVTGFFLKLSAYTGHTITLDHDGTNIINTSGSATDITISGDYVAILWVNIDTVGDAVGIIVAPSYPTSGSLPAHVHSGADITSGAINSIPVGSVTPSTGSFTTGGYSSTFTANTLSSSGATLTGGTINGMVIGGVTPAAGTFTNLNGTTVNLDGGTIDGTVIGGASAAAATVTTFHATGAGTFDSTLAVAGNVIINTDDLFVNTSTGLVGIGTASPTSILHLIGSITGAYGVLLAPTVSLSTSLAGIRLAPVITMTANVLGRGMSFVPTVTIGVNTGNWYGNYFGPTIASGANNLTNYYGNYFLISTASGYTVDIASAFGAYIDTPVKGGSGALLSVYGAYINNQTVGATNNYGLYLVGASGGSGINHTLHVASGESYFGDVIEIAELGSTPATPTASGPWRIYAKGDKLIFFFNNAGTSKWWYLDGTGTASTITYTASAP